MEERCEGLILIADDEPDIRGLLKIFLGREGYEVLEAANGTEAVECAHRNSGKLSLIILDIMMPKLDGISAAGKIREYTDVPILFLTALSSDRDKNAAYALGGDDYMVKPFRATDLVLKVRALIKRYRMYLDAVKSTDIQYGEYAWRGQDCAFFPDKKRVVRKGEEIQLTERECQLLDCLFANRGKAVTTEQLYEAVWKEPYLSTMSNTVIVHIANLRRKLEDNPSRPELIRTVWGRGYKID